MRTVAEERDDDADGYGEQNIMGVMVLRSQFRQREGTNEQPNLPEPEHQGKTFRRKVSPTRSAIKLPAMSIAPITGATTATIFQKLV